MKKTIFALSCLVAVPTYGVTTSLITIDFANKVGDPATPDPIVTAATPSDVTSSTFSFGTAVGSNFVEFGGGSFEVAGFDDFTTVGINAANIGNTGWGMGIGSGNVPGLGAWTADNSPDVGLQPAGSEFADYGNGATTHRLSMSFTQPVVLTQISAGWWDDGGAGSPETWEVTVDGVTVSANPASEGSLDLTATALPQTTFSGVTGVFLLPGQTFEFGPGGTDTWDGANDVLQPDGNLDNGTLSSLQLYVVPEPTSLALVSLASLGLLRRRR